jgi:uncharacterized protein (TIGR03437 family)
VALAGLLLYGARCASSQTPETTGAVHAGAPMFLLQSRYELRPGEPAEIAAAAGTLDFLLHAKTRQVTVEGRETSGLVAAPNHTGDGILLAASSQAKPGEYTVTLSATSATGEVRQTALELDVRQMVTVPTGSTRNPVVLLNGWETGFTGACPVATSSSTTFGNLAQYLVQDGVPVVYLFDNCAEGANQSIETLALGLGSYLNSIKYADGTQVPQIDLVAHSMGGLIARAYLAGLQPNETYLPPAIPLVGKLVLIATPNFGSFVAGQYGILLPAGTQGAELEPGSAFLWNLATWNQHGDDLRGVSAMAIVGNAGAYIPSVSSPTQLLGASDGLVSETSASLSFIIPAPSATSPANTRVVPYCHVDPSAFTNTSLGTFNCNAPGIANVTDTSQETGQIVRSFLAGTTDWQSIGTAPAKDPILSTNGGWFFAVQNSTGLYVSDLTQVEWGSVPLTDGGNIGTIYYTDFVTGSGNFTATSAALGAINCGPLTADRLGQNFAAARCKQGAAIQPALTGPPISVTPLSTTAAGAAVTAGTTITLNGENFGPQCGTCTVVASPAGSATSQKLTVTSWASTAISVNLPASLTGLLTIKVDAVTGIDEIGVWAVSAAAPVTLSATPAALQFAYTAGGAVPSAQSIAIDNSGAGALAWSATASASWLSLSAASGTAPSAISVSVLPASLSAGAYHGTVQIAATGASNTPLSIAVTLTVTAAPAILVVAPQTIAFQYTGGGSVPAAQAISIANGGAGALSWTASGGAFWTALSATAGSAPGTLSVSVNPANLAAGSYTTTITIAAQDPSVSPASVAVTFVVQGAIAPGTIAAVVNAASYQPGFAAATWVAIFGANLSQLTYAWQAGDIVNGMLPTTLEGISVTMNGQPAYVSYISPTQINVLAPDDATVGPVEVQVTLGGQARDAVTAQKNQFAPAFFTFDGTHATAQHLDYSLVGAPNLLPGLVTTPAQPGETILLYGTGFGPTNPAQPTGQTVTAAAPLANPVQLSIGGVAVTPGFSGLSGSGLYQFNVTVPVSLPAGDAAVLASIGGVATQTGVLITVGQ